MKKYELSIVFHPDLEMNLDPALDKVRQILSSANANIIKEDNDGKKRLAYPIKGEEYGIYYFMDVELPADMLGKISTTFNITDEILRYLLVRADTSRAARPVATAEEKVEEFAEEPAEEQEVQEQPEEQEEQEQPAAEEIEAKDNLKKEEEE